jgi:hypothetical protein
MKKNTKLKTKLSLLQNQPTASQIWQKVLYASCQESEEHFIVS